MKRVEAMETTVKTTLSTRTQQGTSPAVAHGHQRRGVTVRVAVTKVLSVVVMVLVPGGLLIAAAYVLARLVTQQMKLEQGPQGQRLARAVATVRWSDVMRETRKLW